MMALQGRPAIVCSMLPLASSGPEIVGAVVAAAGLCVWLLLRLEAREELEDDAEHEAEREPDEDLLSPR